MVVRVALPADHPRSRAQEVTPQSPANWQPGALTMGLSRPSSVGPHPLKSVMESSLELRAPTVMWFLAVAGGAVERYPLAGRMPSSRHREQPRSLPPAQTIRNGLPSPPVTIESITAEVTP